MTGADAAQASATALFFCARALLSVLERFNFEKGETRGARRRPARSERKNRVFPRNDRPYGLKCKAFQTENAFAGGSVKELIEYVAKSLVDHPEQVTVRELPSDEGRILQLEVAKDDIGKIIGKQGRTARALRILLSAASARAQQRTLLEIQE